LTGYPVPGLFRLLSRGHLSPVARGGEAPVSKCPDLHCEGCGGGEAAAVVAVAAAMIAAVIAVAAKVLIIIGTIVAVTFAVLGYAAVRSWRRGWRPSLNPVVAWQPHVAIEAEPRPVTARPAQALPAPQQIHIHFHFHGLDAGQAAEVVRRQAVTGRDD
jgi:hypothetical protein